MLPLDFGAIHPYLLRIEVSAERLGLAGFTYPRPADDLSLTSMQTGDAQRARA
jgi:hypothetical protein